MATTRFPSGDVRKPMGSPRPKGRENAKDTLCRNVLIYGHCRYEDQGCAFNHDPNKTHTSQVDGVKPKKQLNVDSLSFTPTSSNSSLATLSARAAIAAPFTPRSNVSGTATPNIQDEVPVFNVAQIKEFTPQAQPAYDVTQTATLNGNAVDQAAYDPYSMPPATQPLPTTQYNPYLEDNSGLGATGASYYPGQTYGSSTLPPPNYHLYAPIGPHREDLLPYQRTVHDFFIPDTLREDLQKKSDASLQAFPNSQLPTLDDFHSLVALDINHHKSASVFGYPSWVYKALSIKNGNFYCLRRLEGFRLNNEKAIRSVKDWKRVDSSNVVSIHDAFTTRAFGDSSLIFVTDYHPLSKTLAEQHFPTNRFINRAASTVPEHVLWGYIVQIASALKTIHSAGLAARCIDSSKVILTDKNRIRLNACAVLDVAQHGVNRPLPELQQEDFQHFGRLILSIAVNNISVQHLTKNATEHLGRLYTAELRDTIIWLITPTQPSAPKTIDDFLRGIAPQIATSFNNSLNAQDTLNSNLSRELENGRLFRLIAKLGTINERPEFESDRNWSEVGERYMLKLYRDYVFHQVDADGHPVVNLGHIVLSLNKLDAGTDEKIMLTSRDEQTAFLVSYKELKKQANAAFGELVKAQQTPPRTY